MMMSMRSAEIAPTERVGRYTEIVLYWIVSHGIHVTGIFTYTYIYIVDFSSKLVGYSIAVPWILSAGVKIHQHFQLSNLSCLKFAVNLEL